MSQKLRLILFFTFFCFAFSVGGQTDCETLTTFEVGDEWIYTQSYQTQAGSDPKSFIIEEEVEWEGRQALVVRPGLFAGQEYLAQEEGRVYFWDDALGEYQLTYDFDNDSLYYIRYLSYATNAIDSFAVVVDSIKIDQIDEKNIQVQYCRSNLGSGGALFPFKIYRGIGFQNFGVRLLIGVVDINVGGLRCFESPDCNIKFVDFPCDTSTVSVHSLKSSLDLKIHPNPVNDRIYLETTDQNWSYQVINLQGQQMMQGQYQDHIDVDQLPSGIYFLQLQEEGEWYRTIKFVKE